MTRLDQSWVLFEQQAFNATGEDHFLESKKPMCLWPLEGDYRRLLQRPFCQNWRSLNNSSAFKSPTERQDPGEHGCRLKVSSPAWSKKACCQSLPNRHVVWVLLLQAFAAWRGWDADSAATLLAGYLLLRLSLQWIVSPRSGVALLSFVLVSWCVVCFRAPPLRPPRLLTRQLCGSDCIYPPRSSVSSG